MKFRQIIFAVLCAALISMFINTGSLGVAQASDSDLDFDLYESKPQNSAQPDFVNVKNVQPEEESVFSAIRNDILLVIEIIIALVFFRIFSAYYKNTKKIAEEMRYSRKELDDRLDSEMKTIKDMVEKKFEEGAQFIKEMIENSPQNQPPTQSVKPVEPIGNNAKKTNISITEGDIDFTATFDVKEIDNIILARLKTILKQKRKATASKPVGDKRVVKNAKPVIRKRPDPEIEDGRDANSKKKFEFKNS